MSKTKQSHKLLTALTALLLIFTLSACSFNGGRSVAEYVDTVRDDTRKAVNITRDIRKQQETLDCRNKDDAKKLIASLDELSSLYTELSKLDSPDRYTDLDEEIKTNSETALGCVSQLKTLASTAMNTGDDTFYKQEYAGITEEYDAAFNILVDISSQVTTRFRND